MFERTPGEKQQFRDDRLSILIDIGEVRSHDLETDGNKKAMMALSESLTGYGGNLVNICSNLARLALEQRPVRMGPGKDAEERDVTLSDINVLRAAIKAELKRIGKEETDEVIILRKALSRINSVQLFYRVVYGGPFSYMEKVVGRNNIAVLNQKQRYLAGISEDRLPRTTIKIVKGNITDEISVVDLRINPENAKRIYEILKVLEVERPTEHMQIKPGKNIVGRTVSRAGEAEFFWNRLPRGLKEPRAPKAETT